MNKKSNPCTDNLTDEEYLTHMIPHHQVAIDMSIELQKKTKKPNMIYLSREITRKQDYEIWEQLDPVLNRTHTPFIDVPVDKIRKDL